MTVTTWPVGTIVKPIKFGGLFLVVHSAEIGDSAEMQRIVDLVRAATGVHLSQALPALPTPGAPYSNVAVVACYESGLPIPGTPVIYINPEAFEEAL